MVLFWGLRRSKKGVAALRFRLFAGVWGYFGPDSYRRPAGGENFGVFERPKAISGIKFGGYSRQLHVCKAARAAHCEFLKGRPPSSFVSFLMSVFLNARD